MAAPRLTGTVKFYNEVKGYGFIELADGRSIFMHVSQWVDDDEPVPGQRVSFIEDVGRDGRKVARQIMPS